MNRLQAICIRSIGAVFGFVFSWLLALPSPVAAQAIEVAPISVDLPAGRLAGTITITNHGTAPTTIQVRPFAWDQTTTENHLSPTQDLLVSPPFTTMGPGERQTIRLVLRKPAGAREDSYRLLIDELPPAAAPGSVRVALRISMPVFAAPSATAKPSLTWHFSVTDAAHGILSVRNDGTRHARVFAVKLTAPGASLSIPATTFAYILPGSETRIPVTIAAAPSRDHAVVTVSAKSDQGEIRADAPVTPSP